MRSGWHRAALAFCALVFLASMVFWATSYFYQNGLIHADASGMRYVQLHSEEGCVGIGITTYAPGRQWGPRGMFLTPYSSPMYAGWRNLSVRSLFDFGYENRTYQLARPISANSSLNPRPKMLVMQSRGIRAPWWTISLLSVIFPIWIFLRGRGKKVRWFREEISWTDPRLIARVGRFSIFSAIGIVVGAIVAWKAVRTPFAFRQWLWATPWLLLPIACLLVVYTRRRIPLHRAILWMGLDFAGCVCFFQFTIQQIWTHDRVLYFEVQDMLDMVLCAGLVSFVAGSILLFFVQVKPEPAKPGPYCPQCGYCLIGSTRRMCTECGRPFTLEELGITAETLHPPQLHTA